MSSPVLSPIRWLVIPGTTILTKKNNLVSVIGISIARIVLVILGQWENDMVRILRLYLLLTLLIRELPFALFNGRLPRRFTNHGRL